MYVDERGKGHCGRLWEITSGTATFFEGFTACCESCFFGGAGYVSIPSHRPYEVKMSLHPFYIGRDRGSARVTNFPEVTQVAGGGAGFQMQKGISGACPRAVTHSSMSPGAAKDPRDRPSRSPCSAQPRKQTLDTFHPPGGTGAFPSRGWQCTQASAVTGFRRPTLKLDRDPPRCNELCDQEQHVPAHKQQQPADQGA